MSSYLVYNKFTQGITAQPKPMSSNPLDNIRVDISNLDKELLRLLAERRELVRQVASIKTEHGIPLRDKNRENELLSHLIRLGQEKNLDSHFILSLIHI